MTDGCECSTLWSTNKAAFVGKKKKNHKCLSLSLSAKRCLSTMETSARAECRASHRHNSDGYWDDKKFWSELNLEESVWRECRKRYSGSKCVKKLNILGTKKNTNDKNDEL